MLSVKAVTVVDVVVSFGELASFTAVVTLAVMVVTIVEVLVVTLGVVLLIVLLFVEFLVTSDLGFSVEVLTTAGLRAPIGFNS